MAKKAGGVSVPLIAVATLRVLAKIVGFVGFVAGVLWLLWWFSETPEGNLTLAALAALFGIAWLVSSEMEEMERQK
jgi:hypothetical protein